MYCTSFVFNRSINWCLTPTLAVLQLYCGVILLTKNNARRPHFVTNFYIGTLNLKKKIMLAIALDKFTDLFISCCQIFRVQISLLTFLMECHIHFRDLNK